MKSLGLGGPSLGDTPFSTSAGTIANSTVAISNLIKTVAPQSGSKTTAGVVSESLLKFGGPLLAIPGLGEVAIGVGSLILGAAVLVDSIWGSSQSKASLEQAGQYDIANTQIIQQIQQLDAHTRSIKDGLLSLNDALKSAGLPGASGLHGLGNFASDQLNAAIATNSTLKVALNQKTSDLQSLIGIFNTAVQDTYDAVTGKGKAEKYILWSLLGLAGCGFAWLTYKEITREKF